jgi:hypothetical protein
MWTAFTIPFVLVAIIVATGPVYYMAYHSKRYGHIASQKEAKDPQAFGWATCPECKAIVSDPVEHGVAVHSFA